MNRYPSVHSNGSPAQQRLPQVLVLELNGVPLEFRGGDAPYISFSNEPAISVLPPEVLHKQAAPSPQNYSI